ncbi:DinB family protein [Granulicella sp. dw_53]|uniref:DinB family protein n=1 Tax=Granulicella sp. dw_53 TaxID=2719792 RepID=UPI001BD27BB1|nr:DinB family protein [Granulicella sp. dw_53]
MVEPWLRGGLTELDPLRRGVLHALELAVEDVAKWCGELSEAEMEVRPYGVAPVGFHLRHMARSLDRLLTYAEGASLSMAQLKKLRSEMETGGRDATLLEFAEGMEVAVTRVRRFAPEGYFEARRVGREKLPTTVGGLLVHCAEHTQRHAGQAVTTAKVVMGMRG